MKILYAGELRAGTSCLYRKLALERLGHQIIAFDPQAYFPKNRLLRSASFHMAVGMHVSRMNDDLLAVAENEKPEYFWADKILLLQPSTLKKMRQSGITSISYMIDNAFGPRRDSGWRLYLKTLPEFDLHVTQRDVSLNHYRQRGARNVMKIQTAYEPTIHFPPPSALKDSERDRDVSFIGTPYDDRAAILTAVSDARIPLTISGSPGPWRRALTHETYQRVFREGELYETAYREAIWRSKINLSFITHSNQDEYAHKSFEIAGCGGFLLAERSEGHSGKFLEDHEAVFFSGREELIAKILRYLPDEAGRNRIAEAGHRRALRDGYCNDVQVQRVLERAQGIRRDTTPAEPGQGHDGR